MLIIAILTGFFWALLLFSPLDSGNKWPGLYRQLIYIIINFVLGLVTYRLLALFLHIKVVMILTGLFILISGFRWLGVLSKDFFSLFWRSTFGDFGRLSQSYSVYFTGLAAMAQMSAMGGALQGFTEILFIHIFLAGFLLILFPFREKLSGRTWLQSLIGVETGIYLTVMGLIIMGGDVPYFIKGFEKILHI